ncbi:PD-(D/E)XK nuclease family protein [Olsenella profusa]|uniref:PD-(D/E)XK nuclease family protein n=1 Tax=Olsenella profusa TaxID=138595 RepID=A0ABS2F4S2_9ACTN|nr:PD-(D/E)XK nuclease family protein [Olsenella profusa]MBM6775519.1 PD-(D/E)XK nuclease family protein [Olsenella profusa]
MPLTLVRTPDERPCGPDTLCLLRAALAAAGRVVLLVPSFAQALDAQRVLAAAGGLALGVTVSTPGAWAEERWGVWGDGRRLVGDVARDVLAARVLSRAATRPGTAVADTPGTAALLADLARRGLPWLAGAEVPAGVTDAEAAVVALLQDYAAELAARGLVEPCEVLASLPEALDAADAAVPPVVLAGFSELRRPERELVCGLARAHEVTVMAPRSGGPATAQAERALAALCELARSRGVLLGEKNLPSAQDAPQDGAPRAAELAALSAALFRADAPTVAPAGAVRLLLPAGPSARAELVAHEVEALVADGAREVVIAAPDAPSAWRALAPRLVARGVTARAQLSVPMPQLEAGRAFLELARGMARLADLTATWPAARPVPGAPRAGTVRVELEDMSWWPPRDLSDYLVSDVSHVPAARARRLDAQWRGNRLLTPQVLLDQLASERETSPETAAAVRELLRGRIGSAASKLLAPFAQGEKRGAPGAAEAVAALTAVLDVARSLKELGLTADPEAPGHVALSELVELAAAALERTVCTLRPERTAAGARAVVTVEGVRAAARRAPGSVDALVLLGQTSTESALPATDDVRSALLAAYGVEDVPRPMEAERARFAALVGVPRGVLLAERPLFGADGKECYPSVMLTELLACYGIDAAAGADELAAALGDAACSRSETCVRENASAAGRAPRLEATERPAPAGRIGAEERVCVSPPPEGVAAEDARPVLSASQIETYLECPYKWFSLRRLRLRDADAGFTGAEMGTFAHRVLELTHRELLARAVERAEGTHALADLRTARPRALEDLEYRELVEELAARAQQVPTVRLPGPAADGPEALAEAREVLSEEFDLHLSHQYQLVGGRRPLPQALVPHSAQQAGQLERLRRDLLSLLDFESEALTGFEPRLFEWGFGRGGAEVSYAGVRLTGTVDRVDVDAHGQAVVIDYKHKSDAGFAAEYDAFGKDGAPSEGFVLPRRVQSLIYGQVARRAFPDLTVRAAVYLCTKGAHAIAGAVDENLADNVFGARPLTSQRTRRVCVPRAASFGREGQGGMEALLDACEEAIAARIERLLAGDIEAAPVDADACQFCPVLNCERRLRK